MKFLLVFNSKLSLKTKQYLTDQVTEEFIEELQSKGHNVSLFGQFPQGEAVKDFEKLKVKVYGRTTIKNKLLNYFLLYIASIKCIFYSDFIYFHFPSSYKYMPLLCILLGKKYGIHIRGQRSLFSPILGYIYRKATTIICVSSEFSKQINDTYDINKAKVIERSLIPYGEYDIYSNRVYKNLNELKVLYLARVEFDKGIFELLKSISVLNHDLKKTVKLTIVGDGGSMNEVKSIINDLGINDLVNVEGGIWDYNIKADFYKAADVYILPSYHEGFPQTLHEAMVFGTPIITTMVGGIPSLMKDKENCIAIEPKSVGSIVEALQYAFNNYEMMGEFARRAQKTIRCLVDSSKPTHAAQLLSSI